jgi:hypothetical protein
MGQRERAVIEKHYSWPKIADQMAQAYYWLQDRSLPTPPLGAGELGPLQNRLFLSLYLELL